MQARPAGISLVLPPPIDAKLGQVLQQLGFELECKELKKFSKPNLTFHRIRGASSVVNLLYWSDEQTRSALPANQILALFVRIRRDTLSECAEPPHLVFLTHGDYPSAWKEEARDCAAVGVMSFVERTLGAIEEWEEEGFDKVYAFANELIRETSLTPLRDRAPSSTRPGARDGFERPAAGPALVVDAPPAPPTGPLVFISYAHADEEGGGWYSRVDRFIGPLRQKYPDRIWSDKDIKPGAQWHEDVQRALHAAPIVLMLVSQAFLISPYIAASELAETMKAADEKRKTLLWVLIETCAYEAVGIDRFQSAHSLKPLKTMTEVERDEELHKVYRALNQALEGLAKR